MKLLCSILSIFLLSTCSLALPAWLPFQPRKAITPTYNIYERDIDEHYTYAGIGPQPTVPSLAPTSTKASVCNRDNCIRQLIGKSDQATIFCSIYAKFPEIVDPSFVSKCKEDPKRIKSACACLPSPTSSVSSGDATLTSAPTGSATPVASFSSTGDLSATKLSTYSTLRPSGYSTLVGTGYETASSPTQSNSPTTSPPYTTHIPSVTGYQNSTSFTRDTSSTIFPPFPTTAGNISPIISTSGTGYPLPSSSSVTNTTLTRTETIFDIVTATPMTSDALSSSTAGSVTSDIGGIITSTSSSTNRTLTSTHTIINTVTDTPTISDILPPYNSLPGSSATSDFDGIATFTSSSTIMALTSTQTISNTVTETPTISEVLSSHNYTLGSSATSDIDGIATFTSSAVGYGGSPVSADIESGLSSTHCATSDVGFVATATATGYGGY